MRIKRVGRKITERESEGEEGIQTKEESQKLRVKESQNKEGYKKRRAKQQH